MGLASADHLKTPQPFRASAVVSNSLFAIGRKAVVDIYHNRANLIRQKITLAEMRASVVSAGFWSIAPIIIAATGLRSAEKPRDPLRNSNGNRGLRLIPIF
jgi:hypothetical protein